MTSSRSKGIRYWIAYGLLVGPFTVFYALTVSPFTVQFFRTFASSPDVADVALLGIWPLQRVHEFFLPLFVVCLEVIGIQLATSAWSLGMRRRWAAAVPVLAVWLAVQAFPFFSVYLDSRETAFRAKDAEFDPADLIARERVIAGNTKVTTEYQLARKAYEDDVNLWAAATGDRVSNLRWKASSGTSGSNGSEWLAAMQRNEWNPSIGIGGRNQRNTQAGLKTDADGFRDREAEVLRSGRLSHRSP